MSCKCDEHREAEIRAIEQFFEVTNPTWSPIWRHSRAVIEWSKGFKLVDGPPRLVLVPRMPDR